MIEEIKKQHIVLPNRYCIPDLKQLYCCLVKFMPFNRFK